MWGSGADGESGPFTRWTEATNVDFSGWIDPCVSATYISRDDITDVVHYLHAMYVVHYLRRCCKTCGGGCTHLPDVSPTYLLCIQSTLSS